MIFLFACKSDDRIENCNFLLNASVNVQLNLNLPQYSDLQFTTNSVYVANQGNLGIIVTNVGTGYRAWDAADPNHSVNACSFLNIEGIEAVCGCEDANTYSLINGASLEKQLPCGLKEYRITQSGNILNVFD